MKPQKPSIPIWAGSFDRDPTVHFWYESHGERLRLCDDAKWTQETEGFNETTPFVPCTECQELYTQDITGANKLLRYVDPQDYVLYSPKIAGYTTETVVYPAEKEGYVMTTKSPIRVPMSTFARFFEATEMQKITVVKDALANQSDHEGYHLRDFYHPLRNRLRKTHWETGNIGTFEAGFEDFVAEQKEDKQRHYQLIGTSYIKFWKKRQATLFKIDSAKTVVNVKGLSIQVFPEFGMSYSSNNFVTRMWLNAEPPKKEFRLATQYLTGRAKEQGWQANWKAAMWDIRREEIVHDLPITNMRNLKFAINSNAVSFQNTWEDLMASEEQ